MACGAEKIGPSKRIAQEVLDGLLGNVARRQHLGIIDDSAISFAEFAKVWWERVERGLKPTTQVRWKGIREKHLERGFPGCLRGISAAGTESYIATRLEAKATPSTVNREITVLKHMLKRAVLWEYLTLNPLVNLKGSERTGRSHAVPVPRRDREPARMLPAQGHPPGISGCLSQTFRARRVEHRYAPRRDPFTHWSICGLAE
jgi:hypothetical protein